MKGNNNNSKTGKEDFLNYFGGKSTPSGKNEYERMLQKDPFEAEANEGFDGMEAGQIKKDLEIMSRRIASRKTARRTNVVLKIAAAVTVLAAIGTILYLGSEKANRPGPIAEANRNIEIVAKDDPDTLSPSEPSLLQEMKAQSPVIDHKKSADVSEVSAGAEKAGAAADADFLAVAAESIEAEEEIIAEENVSAARSEDVKKAPEKTMSIKPAELAVNSEAKLSGRKPGDSLQGMIAGVVISSDDRLPLPGASVTVKGTSIGTTTDINGQFALPANQVADRMLVASFIGMEAMEFKATEGARKEVVLDPSLAALNEVVIVGYGTRKRELTKGGAVSSIEFDDKTPDVKYNPPEPEGGRDAFKEYMANELVNPPSLEEGERAVVVVSFIVSPTGERDSLRVLKTSGEEFTTEALRAINNGPRWKPATLNGIKTEEEVKIRIIFR